MKFANSAYGSVTRTIAAVVTAAMLVLVGGLGASAATPESADVADPLFVVTDDGIVVDEFYLSEATEDRLAAAIEVGDPVVATEPGVITPQFQMGLGTGLYVYLNAKDVKAVLATGIGGAAALCNANPLVGLSCSVIAALIVANLPDDIPPAGYCVELKYQPTGPGGTWNVVSNKIVKKKC